MAGNANDSFESLCEVCVVLLHESLEGMERMRRPPKASSIYMNRNQVRVY